MTRLLPLLAALLVVPAPAIAAEIDGATLGFAWALPFVGILLSIALFPLLAPHAWEHHQGKIAAFWAALVIVPLALIKGFDVALGAAAHTILLEYIPFILLIFALFTIAGGIVVTGNIHGSPVANTAMLLVGTALASLIGTTGASMVMIRPMIRANDDRRYNVHVFVFFIFLVSNLGGSLTPLGDPPLFLGFLRGVSFFWPTTHLLAEALVSVAIVTLVFFLLDTYLYRKETPRLPDPTPDNNRIGVKGFANFVLIGVVIAAILVSGAWKPGVAVTIAGTPLEGQNLFRDAVMLLAGIASLVLTPKQHREANVFSWGPILEVAKLFAGIFLCMLPVLAMLRAGTNGAFAPLVSMVTNPDGSANTTAYFWLTGALSSFLDNAPTYLVFFELAGGNPQELMTKGALTLAAISCGAVFMGANSYIGNAPNFMVYAIARDGGIRMPSFFGYMLWSVAVLIPVFVLVTFLFFWQ